VTPIAFIDFETYSEAGFVWNAEHDKWDCLPGATKKGLPVVGASVYVEHPSFEVLTLSYDVGDGIKRWRPGEPPPVDLLVHVQQGGMISGWNSGGFEFKVWRHLADSYHWPSLRLEQTIDTMAHARSHALPGALGKAAEVMGLKQLKDAAGDRLIKKFSMPRNPTKANLSLRIVSTDDPEDFERFQAYCDQDVRTEQEAASCIPPLSEQEREDWLCDRRINDRGVRVDVGGVNNCIAIIEQAHERYNAELRLLTGGTVERASELQKLIGWLGALGVHTNSLDEENVEALLKQELPPAARRALEIRRAIGSASVKKVFAMRNMTSADGRLRDLFIFHGARTGRPTGSGPQPTNLPNSAGAYAMECEGCGKHYNASGKHGCPWCGGNVGWAHTIEWNAACAEDALESFKSRSVDWVEYVWSDAMAAVSNSLRALFIAAPGHDLICSDYSSIEAVGLAMLAEEQWRIDVFRTHGKIYEMSAAKITGIPFEEFMIHAGYTREQLEQLEWWTHKPINVGSHHPMRKKIGKIAELGSGYGGWINSWKRFGADEFLSEEEMKAGILAWRAASPAIPLLWGGQQWEWRTHYYGVEGCFVQAILYPGHIFSTHGLQFEMRGDVLYLRLLSSRELTYHRPRLVKVSEGWRSGTYSISYEGWNSNPENGPTGWIRMTTWGSRIVENINQGQCRDIQWHGVKNLEKQGYPVVLHVYDEDVAEVPENFGSVEELEAIMEELPTWASDWPIKANGGWRGKRYRK
jgi:DNA polymerase